MPGESESESKYTTTTLPMQQENIDKFNIDTN